MQSLHLFVGIVLFNIMKKRHEQKLVILSMLLLLALNIPLLLLFDNSESLFGFPTIYIYILSAWLFSIAISYTIVKKYYE
jgi:predicted MFS family arabinose efflux permease